MNERAATLKPVSELASMHWLSLAAWPSCPLSPAYIEIWSGPVVSFCTLIAFVKDAVTCPPRNLAP